MNISYTSQDVELVKQMSIEQREALKAQINLTDPHDISIFSPHPKANRNPDKRNIICPVCGNGTGSDSTPVEVTLKGDRWLYNCFKCDSFSGDLLKIIADMNHLNLSDFEGMCTALALGANLIGYNLAIESKPSSKSARKNSEQDPIEREERELIKSDIHAAREKIDFLPQTELRGLKLETYIHFNCGYLYSWKAPKCRLAGIDTPPSRRIIIPTYNHYNAVALQGDRETLPKKFHKMHAGKLELFNACVLPFSDILFVTEGEFDAMSIWQASEGEIPAVAVLGASNWKRTLPPFFDTLVKKKIKVIILFDSDEAGKNNAANLRTELLKKKIPAVCKFLFDFLSKADKSSLGEKVDANDILQKRGDHFLKKLLEEIRTVARDDDFDSVEKEIASRADSENQKTPSPKEHSLHPSNAPIEANSKDGDIYAEIRAQCEWTFDKKGKPRKIKATYKNLYLIFSKDPSLKNLIGYEEFQGVDVFLKTPPWKKGECKYTEWTDKDDSQLRLYLRDNYADLSDNQLITDMLVKVSQDNSFNVVKNFFKELPSWDGEERLEKLFVKFLRADDSAYTRTITRNWFIGAIARIYHPGCRYQTALVLHGNQKIGKSYIIEKLGGHWYLDLTSNVDDSHAADALKKGWIVELKENAPTRKSEINAVKSFIERPSETRREAYAKRATTTKRHCVFVITVNDDEFLRDQTGNRRYMVLHCDSPMYDYVEGLTDEYIKQVWAEALHIYNEMFDHDKAFDEKKLSLPNSIEIEAEKIASRYLQDDGMANEIAGFLERKIPPQCIWQELTREERREFFKRGFLELIDGEEDLKNRRRARVGKTVEKDCDEITDFLIGQSSKNFVRTKENTKSLPPVTTFYIYGSEYREHICAAEIFNECFGSDKRKQMYRINETLSKLEGWQLGDRLRKADTVYPDQKKPYYRKPVEEKTDEPAQAFDDFQGKLVNPDDVPF